MTRSSMPLLLFALLAISQCSAFRKQITTVELASPLPVPIVLTHFTTNSDIFSFNVNDQGMTTLDKTWVWFSGLTKGYLHEPTFNSEQNVNMMLLLLTPQELAEIAKESAVYSNTDGPFSMQIPSEEADANPGNVTETTLQNWMLPSAAWKKLSDPGRVTPEVAANLIKDYTTASQLLTPNTYVLTEMMPKVGKKKGNLPQASLQFLPKVSFKPFEVGNIALRPDVYEKLVREGKVTFYKHEDMLPFPFPPETPYRGDFSYIKLIMDDRFISNSGLLKIETDLTYGCCWSTPEGSSPQLSRYDWNRWVLKVTRRSKRLGIDRGTAMSMQKNFLELHKLIGHPGVQEELKKRQLIS